MTSAGDAAVALLKAGAETDKKDIDGMLALDLAPGNDVSVTTLHRWTARLLCFQVRRYIERAAEMEGIDI